MTQTRSRTFYGIGAKSTAAHAAWQLPNAVLQATTVAGAVAPSVAPQMNLAAEYHAMTTPEQPA